MHEYLKKIVRQKYLKADKKEKTKLLDEAERITGLNRRYLMEKLKAKSNLDKEPGNRKTRSRTYGNETIPALACLWRIFDKPCGQRLTVQIKDELDGLREEKEIKCSDKIASKLKKMSSATIDRYLVPVKKREAGKRRKKRVNSLLYSRVPIKKFGEQNRSSVGFIQADLIVHSGRSLRGDYLYTVSTTDINFGWWEGAAQMGRGQEPTKESLERCRSRFPINWKELHPDNDTAILNAHVAAYCKETGLEFSRSEPYHKNDNCLVEQKNGHVVRQKVGHFRFDTPEELKILESLYSEELSLYRNFFQPQMKLIEKKRIKGKVKRKYKQPKTPYRRIMDSSEVSKEVKRELTETYESLNPAELKRGIDAKVKSLYKAYLGKQKTQKNVQTKVEFGQKIDDLKKEISVR